MKPPKLRSHCPIHFALEVVGDRWTLLLLRDLLIVGKRRYGELIDAPERVASNILADRLRRMQRQGLLQRRADPDDARRALYEPTAKALDLLPVMLELVRWGAAHDPLTAAPAAFVRRIGREREVVEAEIRARNPVAAPVTAPATSSPRRKSA